MKLPLVSEMRELERKTMEDYGIPSLILMENAGLGTVSMAEKLLGSCEDCFCPIFIGPGNNGGDGLVIGRQLHQRGCQPLFFFLQPPEKFKGDALENLKIVEKLHLPFHIIDSTEQVGTIQDTISQYESDGLRCYAIIDAIFGIGLMRDITGHIADIIRCINSLKLREMAPVIAVDIPSGLDTDTGEIRGVSVRADYTATYGCAKPGHFLFGNKALTGHLEVIDVCIPPEVVSQSKINTELADLEVLRENCTRLCRQSASHKGTNGHTFILAGSTGSTGAAVLAGRGALRAGTGLLTLGSLAENNMILQSAVPEAMTMLLHGDPSHLSIKDWPQIKENLDRFSCIVTGPGMGQHADTAELVLKIYHEAHLPVVLDADALNILAAHRKTLGTPSGPRIFTPHPGEMGRILGKPTAEIVKNRLGAAEQGCLLFQNDEYETVMLIKGSGTIICNSEGRCFINTTGNPGMGTGGMGDVLSGIIGAFLSQGMDPFPATTTAAYLHGKAADILFEHMGPGFYASEVTDKLPEARHTLLQHLYGTDLFLS